MEGREYIQIVGAPCAHCSRRIVSLDDGAACRDCPRAVHVEDACWQAHWEAEHAGAADYRGVKKAPPPVRELPPDRVGQPLHFSGGSDALVCTACHHRGFAPTSTSFLGFKRFTCSACAATVLHPLTSTRRTIYWVFLGVVGLVSVIALTQGVIAFPGVLTIFVIVALSEDKTIRRKLDIAEVAAPPRYEDSGPIDLDPPKKRKRKRAKAVSASDTA